jgi:hypothetical protein
MMTGAVLLALAAGTAVRAQIWTERFDDVAGLVDSGWVIINNSNPNPENRTPLFPGTFQASLLDPPPVFAAHEGGSDSYAAMNHNSTSSGGKISTWLIGPALSFGPGDTFSFFTRTAAQPQFPDRPEVRVRCLGDSVHVGTGHESVGDFTTLLLTVNEGLTVTGYPSEVTSPK